ncbi:MAG: FHA domain-containing protein [Actinomycetota bacterium]|nr:FHA domain-containing protein [Actinomycetota bacterium]
MDESKTFVSAPKLWLTVQSGEHRGTTVEVSGDEFVIGRGTSCDLVLDDPKASRAHAKVSLRGRRPTLQDLDSANGTFVNGHRVRAPLGFSTADPQGKVELTGDEVVQIGDTLMTVSLVDPDLIALIRKERGDRPEPEPQE